jgi:hypothetical protein
LEERRSLAKKKKRPRVPGTVARRPSPAGEPDNTFASAAHEAGHVIVAHALGRHVLRVRIGNVYLAADHPEDPSGVEMISSGFTLFGPLLADEVEERRRTGTPLTAEHVDWLRSEMVLCFPGLIAEAVLTKSRPGADADLAQAGAIAEALGKVEVREDGQVHVDAAFHREAHGVAQAILADLVRNLIALTEMLAAQPNSEWPEEAIQAALSELGSPEGSHRHLLERLV